MNTKEIQKLIAKQQVNKGHNPVCENLNYFRCNCEVECDVVSVSAAGYVYEFEVKITKADFKKDKGKLAKHSAYKQALNSMPNYFYYVCPEGLIKGWQVPPYAGLIYVTATGLFEVIKAPLLHKTKHDLLKLSLKICRVTIERLYLGGCKLTVKNNQIKNRNKQVLAEAGFSDLEIKTYSKNKIRM